MSVFADVALSEKSPYLGGIWVRLGLSNVPESMEVAGLKSAVLPDPRIGFLSG